MVSGIRVPGMQSPADRVLERAADSNWSFHRQVSKNPPPIPSREIEAMVGSTAGIAGATPATRNHRQKRPPRVLCSDETKDGRPNGPDHPVQQRLQLRGSFAFSITARFFRGPYIRIQIALKETRVPKHGVRFAGVALRYAGWTALVLALGRQTRVWVGTATPLTAPNGGHELVHGQNPVPWARAYFSTSASSDMNTSGVRRNACR